MNWVSAWHPPPEPNATFDPESSISKFSINFVFMLFYLIPYFDRSSNLGIT